MMYEVAPYYKRMTAYWRPLVGARDAHFQSCWEVDALVHRAGRVREKGVIARVAKLLDISVQEASGLVVSSRKYHLPTSPVERMLSGRPCKRPLLVPPHLEGTCRLILERLEAGPDPRGMHAREYAALDWLERLGIIETYVHPELRSKWIRLTERVLQEEDDEEMKMRGRE